MQASHLILSFCLFGTFKQKSSFLTFPQALNFFEESLTALFQPLSTQSTLYLSDFPCRFLYRYHFSVFKFKFYIFRYGLCSFPALSQIKEVNFPNSIFFVHVTKYKSECPLEDVPYVILTLNRLVAGQFYQLTLHLFSFDVKEIPIS